MEHQDYREILSELNDLDDWLTELEKDLAKDRQEEPKWVCVERTNMFCAFMNPKGESRIVGAQYIDEIFPEETNG